MIRRLNHASLFPHQECTTTAKPKAALWINQASLRKYFETTQEVIDGKMCDVKSPKERGHTDWTTEANSSPSHCDAEMDAAKVSVGTDTNGVHELMAEQLHKVDFGVSSLAAYGLCETCVQTNAFEEFQSFTKANSKREQRFTAHNFRINQILEEDIIRNKMGTSFSLLT
eukprot:TRINITY_DN221_c0_g1_i11.p1 TRINITY_DN221_c0_g1~~TRINITY_DN221_c0_g1_i11.p1  ORF type:complete len:170 (+),score=29.31 TRINITY_DN221_c0_g1_i11:599-1108(+)